MEPLVCVNHVKKVYGSKHEDKILALQDISFAVNQGEFVGIMGASGSGKSTLLNILSTIDRPTEGLILINQQDITQLGENQMAYFRGEQIGFIFQDFNLLENMTVAENIAVPLTLKNTKSEQIKEKVQKMVDKLEISPLLNKYPAQLSGGQKQRVAIARALISEPVILFGDEPTGSLDSQNAKSLLNLMTTMNKKDNVTILLVTHDPFSASYCDRILFIKDGLLHKELNKQQQERSSFYQEILVHLGNTE